MSNSLLDPSTWSFMTWVEVVYFSIILVGGAIGVSAMRLPFSYCVRNVRVRWLSNLLTILAIALVVWATCLSFGLASGMRNALAIGGGNDERDIIILRDGATAETTSGFARTLVDELATIEGIERSPDGKPLVSPEAVILVNSPRRGGAGRTNLVIRGVTPIALLLRPGFRLTAGAQFATGTMQAISARRISERMESTAMGEQLKLLKGSLEMVGHFEGGGAADSEVWGDLTAISANYGRESGVSVVQIRAVDVPARDAIIAKIKATPQFNELQAMTEADYFAKQNTSLTVLQVMGSIIATFLTFGAVFAGANTMFGAVQGRVREIGTLRAMGYPNFSILFALLIESVLICLSGGVIGTLATVPLNGYATGTTNWDSFSELTFSFAFGPGVILDGLFLSIVMGLVGGIIPAWRATKLPVIEVLRAV